jgi:hypothetical protein
MNSNNPQTDSKSISIGGGENSTNDEEKNLVQKDTKIEIESRPLSLAPSSIKKSSVNNFNNLILSCVKNEEYCFTMLDYLKKMCHYSQLDYYSTYTQLLYCFKPKEM